MRAQSLNKWRNAVDTTDIQEEAKRLVDKLPPKFDVG
jgi:hypothetical protein